MWEGWPPSDYDQGLPVVEIRQDQLRALLADVEERRRLADRRSRFRRHWLLIQDLAGEDDEAVRVGAAVAELLAEMGHLGVTVSMSTAQPTSQQVSTAAAESDEAFLDRLRRLGEDWRYSDEFIGLIVRNRFPRNYDDLVDGDE